MFLALFTGSFLVALALAGVFVSAALATLKYEPTRVWFIYARLVPSTFVATAFAVAAIASARQLREWQR